MKQLSKYIGESHSTDYTNKTSPYLGRFKHEVKYSKEDWDKWVKLVEKEKWGDDIMIGTYDSAPELTVVYKAEHEKSIMGRKGFMDHIASYNKEKEILWCDDIKLFGNDV